MIIIFGTFVSNDDISRHFFHFFEIFIFHAVRRVKGQKMVQNDKKLCLLCPISQEPYITWLSFMVHMCKIISPAGFVFFLFFHFFYFLKILIFQIVRGVKRQKTVQNNKKICPSHFTSLKPFIIWMPFMVHMCKMMISPYVFFIFSKFWFFMLLEG